MKDFKQALEAIELPAGLERRVEEKLEATLGATLREQHVIIKPKPKILRFVLTAAAAVVLLVVSAVFLRQVYASGSRPAEIVPAAETVQIIPAAQPAGVEVSLEREEDYLILYQPVLDAYRYAFESYDYDYCQEHGLYDGFFYVFYYYPHNSIGYTLQDLDGNGVPELLIGWHKDMIHPKTVLETLYDAYYLRDGAPVQLFRADYTNSWHLLEDGRLLQIMNENLSSPSYLLWEFSKPEDGETEALTFLEGMLVDKYSDPEKEVFYRIASVQTEAGEEDNRTFVISLGDSSSATDARAWIKTHSVFLTLPFIPLETSDLTLASSKPDTPPEDLTEQQYLELTALMQRLAEQEEAFALTDYADRQPDEAVILLQQIGVLARERELSAEELRGLLLGRLNLDGASAEAYAALIGKLYQKNPEGFLEAWHEAGEPAEMMDQVTGVSDPALSKLWLQEQWQRRTQAAQEPAGAGETSANFELDWVNGIAVILLHGFSEDCRFVVMTEVLQP